MNGQHNECEILPSCNEISSHTGDGDENTGSKKIKKNIDTPCKDVRYLHFPFFLLPPLICFYFHYFHFSH
jgi:hypothetical protein